MFKCNSTPLSTLQVGWLGTFLDYLHCQGCESCILTSSVSPADMGSHVTQFCSVTHNLKYVSRVFVKSFFFK